jgi:hypothetical protein
MGILGFGRKDPGKEVIPANFAARMLEEFPEIPRDGIGWPESPRWTTREERDREMAEARAAMPTMDELLQDPDVRMLVEAVGDGACKMAVAA